ncbi:diaminopropionate ammonia-lyase [Veillonella caviae]|uniref:diaminopropionate ammonia-lyase n=1 Tax=Veillonella caviae TaxID=248316 RepID=UPI0023A87FFE|nr:diaminopropionate ammonia-lyase [Veillonella caviae]MCI5708718.1 diaminopropionate ammonia-lyase [Veillonella caviae]MCI6406365.1 diaminopropionate ammonia-lyase [Veillonella caviae]
MMEQIKWVRNRMEHSSDKYLPIMDIREVKAAKTFHESFPQYSETPLVSLSQLAENIGLASLFVKDESYRFGLNAFKVLGGSYAIGKYVAEKLGKSVKELPYDVLISQELRDEFGQATFFTATDGNHGRGVAWAANKLGQKSVVFMPKGSTEYRKQQIANEGATVTIEKFNYDDCVRLATAESKKVENGVVVQDTAWDGYEDIPNWIMQGYGTLAMEASQQLEQSGCNIPTHIVVQAGVGSLAGAMVGYFSNFYHDAIYKPKFIVVEADGAACLYKGAVANDGNPRIVEGDLPTIMAGLACGEPNTVSWDILRNHVDYFVAVPDWVARLGMRVSAAPLKGDTSIISGESGAAPLGFIMAVMTMAEYEDLRNELELNEHSKVLCFSTEGNTDPDRYKNIVWYGLDT